MTEPIPMILYCPRCGMQHIDRPEPCTMGVGCDRAGVCYASANGEPDRCPVWRNPPHRTHLCAACGNLWKPALIATTGVASLPPVLSGPLHGVNRMSDVSRAGVWQCKIGECDGDALPAGCDGPMRDAVAAAYEKITGEPPKFIFSGWNATVTPTERAVVNNTDFPNPDAELEAWLDKEWPLWRNGPNKPLVAMVRKAWRAGRDSMGV